MISVTHRAPKDKNHPFTAIPNEIIDNTHLSAEARIILIKMLRNIDGYSYSIDRISHMTGISVSKVRRALNELTDAGHLRCHSTRATGHGAGRGFITTYEIFEQPIAKISTLEDAAT